MLAERQTDTVITILSPPTATGGEVKKERSGVFVEPFPLRDAANDIEWRINK